MQRGLRTFSTVGLAIAFSVVGVTTDGHVGSSLRATVYASSVKHTNHQNSVAKNTAIPDFKHVFIIMLENHSYQDAFFENDMPYLRFLARTYGFPTEMYGITNPTVPDRVGILSGRGRTIGDNVHKGQLTYPNLIDQLSAHHLSWGAYYQHTETSTNAHPVYNFGDSTFNLFQDIYSNSRRQADFHTLPDLAQALKTGNVPNFVWVGPNFITNSHGTGRPGPYQYTYQGAGTGGASTHDTRLEQLANTFLQTWVPRIMDSPLWHSGPSAIFITEDETSYDASMPQIGEWASNLGTAGSPVVPAGTILGGNSAFPFPGGVNGGGRIPAIVITNTARHVISATPFNQFSILKTIESAWHLGYLGQAANPSVSTMSVFFHGGTRPQGAHATPWSTGAPPYATTRATWSTTPYMPAFPPAEVTTTDATVLPSADPHLSAGTKGQAAASLEFFITDHPQTITHDLTITLTGSHGVTFAGRSTPVGTTAVANADENATQFGPSNVTPDTVTVPIANTGTVAERLYLTGLMLNVADGASLGPIKAAVSANGISLGTVVLGTVGRPAVRRSPNLLAPVIRSGSVEIRFVPPSSTPQNVKYEIEIEGQDPATAISPDLLEQKYVAYTSADNVIVSNGAAELTSLAGKLYWVRVRAVRGSGRGFQALSAWSAPLPLTALPGPLPSGVS